MTPRSKLLLSALATTSLFATVATAQSAAKSERTYSFALNGASEVPGPGDPDGTGSATITVSVRDKEVCYSFQAFDIDDLVGAHIHEGSSTVAGPVVVPLDLSGSGCAEVTAGLAAQILARPREYYLNLHTEEFPAGAIRGQLD